jgi:hypothetical protein
MVNQYDNMSQELIQINLHVMYYLFINHSIPKKIMHLQLMFLLHELHSTYPKVQRI